MVYAFGDVTAAGKEGARRLRKGDFVYSGDTVTTGRGRAQIRFTDGGFVSLQPNTEYQLDEYNYEGKDDGSERSFFNLLKGSVRFVTGLVGKANNKNFRIKTSVATIGIRGSGGIATFLPALNQLIVKSQLDTLTIDLGTGVPIVVPVGSAFSCNPGLCTQIAGIQTRTDLQNKFEELDENLGDDDTDPAYVAGNDSSERGTNCAFVACGDAFLKFFQTAAESRPYSNEIESSDYTRSSIALLVTGSGEEPDTFLQVVDDSSVEILTRRPDSFLSALTSGLGVEGSVEGVDEAAAAIRSIFDPVLSAEVSAMPASVTVGGSDDGLISLASFYDGKLLNIRFDEESESFSQHVRTLRDQQAHHIVYGEYPGPLTFGGIGIYDQLIYSATSNAIDGSASGSGIQPGAKLTMNFLTGIGDINMGVSFNSMLFDVQGKVIAAGLDPETMFTGDEVTANGTYPVYLDGVFAGANGDSAPLYAGIAYKVAYDNPFNGAGILGLSGTSAAPAVAESTTIKYALGFYFSGGTVGSLSDGEAGFPLGTSLQSYATTFGDSFDIGSAAVQESGTDPSVAAEWTRFGNGGMPVNYSFVGYPPGGMPFGDKHGISTDLPTPQNVITSTTGTKVFTLAASTQPTLLYDLNYIEGSTGGPSVVQENGTLSVATFTANFSSGQMESVQYEAAFSGDSSSTVKLVGAPTSLTSGFTSLISGTADGQSYITDSANGFVCDSRCAMNGNINWEFASNTPGGPPMAVISSFNGVTASDEYAVSGVALSKYP